MSSRSYWMSNAEKAQRDAKPIARWFVDTPGKPTGLIIGLDLGRQSDFSAVVISQRVAGARVEYRRYTEFEEDIAPHATRPLIQHNLLRLHRYPLGTSYVEIAASIRGVMLQLQDGSGVVPELVVDAGGVGLAVVDALKDQHGLNPVAVTITGGLASTATNDKNWRVAKKALASTMDVVLSERRLQVPAADPLAETLVRELRDFSVKVTASGSEQFAALDRVGLHDDLVMSAALAVWRGENRPQPFCAIHGEGGGLSYLAHLHGR